MITRRRLLLAGALSALSARCVLAQVRPPRIGILAPLAKTTLAPLVLKRLAELGYRQEAGMILEYRSPDGADDRYPRLARELIDAKCDVVFALGDPAAAALHKARSPVPVVFILPDTDPIAKGYVRTLRQPGGNMTGIYVQATALAAKRLEIAQEVLPRAKHFLVLADSYSKDQLFALQAAADRRGIRLTVVEYIQRPRDRDFEAAFETGRRAGVEGLVALNSPNFATNRTKLTGLIAKERLPAFVVPASFAEESGVLLGYHVNTANLGRRAAELGMQILKGGKPAEIPVEQPDDFLLVVNLATARALGVKIPYSVLARATKVIE